MDTENLPISGTPIIVERLARPLGWVQPYADPWFSRFEEVVGGLTGGIEEYARGYGEDADDLPSERQFTEAFTLLRQIRGQILAERRARRARPAG